MPTKTRYGDSPWSFAFPDSRRPNHPKLRGEHARDVVIIGAGLTGVATAYACATAGLKTTVLEAARIGSGAAGRSGGLLLPGNPGSRSLRRPATGADGLRAARTIFESWRRASLDAAALLRRLAIPCGLQPLDSVTIARDEKALRREFDARKRLASRRTGCRQGHLRAAVQLDASGGMRLGDAFGLDPYRACVGLSLAARKRGAAFAEHTRAQGDVRHQRC